MGNGIMDSYSGPTNTTECVLGEGGEIERSGSGEEEECQKLNSWTSIQAQGWLFVEGSVWMRF